MLKRILFAMTMGFGIAAVVVALFAYATWQRLHPEPAASQALINGIVLTMDANNRRAEAVLLEHDQIVAVGSNSEIKALMSEETIITDLGGKTVLPGFIEAHGHFPGAGLFAVVADLNAPPIGKLKSMPELLERVRQQALISKGWVVGWGYDDTLLAEKRHPTRKELDQISGKTPIYLIHVSGHMGVGNSAALAEMGINKDSKPPAGGEIGRNESGELNGLLTENAHKPIAKRALDFGMMQQLQVVRAAAIEYAKNGVTTVQNGLALKEHLKGLNTASKLGLIPQRLMFWPEDKLALQALAGEFELPEVDNEKTFIGATKFIADGSIQGFTGYLSEPYFQRRDNKTAKDYRGFASIGTAELRDGLEKTYCAGGSAAVHGNGDAAIDLILDAWSQVPKKCRGNDPRLIIIHSQMARDDQLERMRSLGATPSFFSAHTFYWGDRHRDIFMGPERAARMSPAASADAIGLRYAIHLDTPVVPIDPLFLAWTASQRQTSSGQSIGPEQRISIQRSLRATTIDAAWQLRIEDKVGSIEIGKKADLVILSDNPLAEGIDLRDIQVENTIVGGVSIHLLAASQPATNQQ